MFGALSGYLLVGMTPVFLILLATGNWFEAFLSVGIIFFLATIFGFISLIFEKE